VVCNAVKSINARLYLVVVTLAQLMLSASGKSGENAVRNAPMALTTTFSGRGDGSRSQQLRMVEKNACPIHQLTNLMRSLASSLDAQFLARVIGRSMTHALPKLLSMETSSVVEALKPRLSSWTSRPNLVARSAATRTERSTHWNVACAHAQCLVKGTLMSGLSAAPVVAVAPCQKPLLFPKLPSMVAPTALTMMATLRSRTVEWTPAQSTAKDHGVNGRNAPRNAQTAKAMARLAQAQGSTESKSQLHMVVSNAHMPMVRLLRRSAMTSAALWIALVLGANLVPARPRVEMVSRHVLTTSLSQPCMVARNAIVAMSPPTQLHAMMVHALSIVKVRGLLGPIAQRSVMEVTRHHGS
jgi:hypothetical protein